MSSSPTMPMVVPAQTGSPQVEAAARSPRSLNFGGLEIGYDDRVLTPRPWTTAQARWLADVLRRHPEGPVLELCSGAGQIGLLAAAYTGRDLVLVDASASACELAERNVAANPVAGSVEIRHGRIDEVLRPDERFVGVLADPPWVPTRGTSRFPQDPPFAIDGGDDGLDLARVCLSVIDRHLNPEGAAVLQLGSTAQATALMDATLTDTVSMDTGLREAVGIDRSWRGDLEPVEIRSYRDRGVLVHLERRP